MKQMVMWVLVALMVGLLAGCLKRGSYGRGWDLALGLAGGVAVGWLSWSQWWISPDPDMATVAFVAAAGAAGLIVAQRTIFPHISRTRRAPQSPDIRF